MPRYACTIILAIIVGHSTAQVSSSQAFSLTLKADTGLDLVLELFEERYLLEFAFATDLTEDRFVAQGHYQGTTLPGLMQDILAKPDLMCEFVQPRKVLLRQQTPATQSPGLLECIVTDNQDHVISDAAIYFKHNNTGTTSDHDGSFRIAADILPGDTLVISHLGYAPVLIPAHQLYEGKIVLQPSPFQFDEVAILSRTPGIRIDNSKDQSTIFAPRSLSGGILFGDPLRSLQLLPGVSAHNDRSARIQIRGSNADETLVFVDGIPIYRADHFYGIFGSVNGNHIEKVTLYKNALPAEYGSKTGGLVVMNSPQVIKNWSGTAEIGLLTSSATIQGVVTPGLQMILSGRTSFGNVADSDVFGSTEAYKAPENSPLNVFTRRSVEPSSPDFSFSDINARFQIDPSTEHRLSLALFYSSDDYSNVFSNQFFSGPLTDRSTFEERFAHLESWSNVGVNLSTRHVISDKWYLRSLSYLTEYTLDGGIDVSLMKNRQGEELDLSYSAGQANNVRDMATQISAHHSAGQLGLGLIHHDVTYAVEANDHALLSGSPRGTELYAFGNYIMYPDEDLQLNIGARMTAYSLTQGWHFSPRLQARYTISPQLNFKGAFTIQHQFVRELEHENRFGQAIGVFVMTDDDQIAPGKTVQSMIGATWKEFEWTIDLEVFHRDMLNVLDHASVSPGFGTNILPDQSTPYTLYTGKGQSTGLDLIIRRDGRKYSGWLAYTLSHTTRQFSEIFNGQSYAAQNDRRHQLKWINSVRQGPWEFNGNVIFSSGKPYIDLRNLVEQRDRKFLSTDDLISHLPSYQRVDIGAAYHFQLIGVDCTAGASIFNVLDRTNVEYIQYLFSLSNGNSNAALGTETNLLQRTFNMQLQFRF